MTTAAHAPDIPATGREAIERAQTLATRFAEGAAGHDAAATFPVENVDALFEAGLLVLTMPRASGGGGFGASVARKVIEVVAMGEPATALTLEMTFAQHARMAATWPASVVERLRRESIERPTLFNVSRVEPALGTPARGGMPATTATRTRDGWRLSGHKLYATGSPAVSYFVVWARTDDEEPKVGYFLVAKSASGVTLLPTWDHVGMRATRSDDLVLENVEIAEDHALDLRQPGEWAPAGAWELSWGALAIGAVYQGVARSARDWLVRYLNERIPANLGAPLASLPRFQVAVGEIEAKLVTNELLLEGVAAQADAGDEEGLGMRAGIVKSVVTRNAIEVVRQGLELTGNPGLSHSNPLERHFRDALCGPVHTPQDDMTFAHAGKSALSQV